MIFLPKAFKTNDFFHKISFLGSIALASLILLCLGTNPADAARGTAADFGKYCRTKYPNSVYQIDRTRWGPRHVCRQTGAGGATKQGIDYAEACRLTTGSRRYQEKGQFILCNASTGKTPTSTKAQKTKADLNQYCRDKYPNSSYRAQQTRWGLRHLCRQVNAGGYTNQPIDLSDACHRTNGSRKFTKIGRAVYCGSGRSIARFSRKRITRVSLQRRSSSKGTVEEIWARNRARVARYCSGGRLKRPAPKYVKLAHRRDNVRLCQIGHKHRMRRGLAKFCASIKRGTYCKRVNPRNKYARCLCALAQNRMLP